MSSPTPISRQHGNTAVAELAGSTCQKFLAVTDANECSVSLMFMQVSNVWHRLFLDAGLLFWEEETGPDADNDLGDDEKYTDLGARLKVNGGTIELIRMTDGVLLVIFTNSACLELTINQDDETRVTRLVPGV